jgi:hypothetical protein
VYVRVTKIKIGLFFPSFSTEPCSETEQEDELEMKK